MHQAVLFDLDGTLLDTARDLGNALNTLLVAEGHKPLDYDEYRCAASDGAMKLLELGFGEYWATMDQTVFRQRFLDAYQNNVATDTCYFDGVIELLETLNQRKIPWGIVTNKPGYLTDALIPHYPLLAACTCIVSGDSLRDKKPNPGPLIFAAGKLGVYPQHTIYLGDAQRDIQAANSAHMTSVVASYGYIPDILDTSSWQADHLIAQPTALLNYL